MIVAVAGRRIDPVGAEVARLPLQRVEAVREDVRAALLRLKASGIISSGACGTDLIAMEVAGALGLRRKMILPFSRAAFRETSVTDRPGAWGPLYDTICDELTKMGDLEELAFLPAGELTYAETNIQIVDRAVTLGREEAHETGADLPNAVALLVWEGASRGEDDMTAHFGAIARHRGLSVTELVTLPR